MSVHENITRQMLAEADEVQARHLMKFFKTGPDEYGYGDRFLGIRVPVTRGFVKDYRKGVDITDIPPLLSSEFHEIRLAGFLLLIELYKRAKKSHDDEATRFLTDYYLSVIDRGNNWDLVDLIAPKILGDRLVDHPYERHLLDQLAEMEGHLWHQRVAIVSTWTLISNREYADTFRIAEKLLNHPHDLIHKAVGWMLREVGKKGGKPRLIDFLDSYGSRMPRTMLRYAIERFPEDERLYYMKSTLT